MEVLLRVDISLAGEYVVFVDPNVAIRVADIAEILSRAAAHFAESAPTCGDQHEVWLDVEGAQRRSVACDLSPGHACPHHGAIDDEGQRACWLGAHT